MISICYRLILQVPYLIADKLSHLIIADCIELWFGKEGALKSHVVCTQSTETPKVSTGWSE